MKIVWLAAGLMALIIVFCFLINNTVSGHVNKILNHLDEAERLADHDEFEGARQSVLAALALWEQKAPLFAMVFPAQRTNEVESALMEVREQLACQDYQSYKAGNALLISALEMLDKGYRVSWENVM